MSFIAVAVVAGTAAYSAYSTSKQQKANLKYNEKVAENEALAIEQQSQLESATRRREKERFAAAQRAGFAKSGAIITEGTPLLAMAEQAGEFELDILNSQINKRNQQMMKLDEAEMYGSQASNINPLISGVMAGAVAGVSTYGSLAKPKAPKAPETTTSNLPNTSSYDYKLSTRR